MQRVLFKPSGLQAVRWTLMPLNSITLDNLICKHYTNTLVHYSNRMYFTNYTTLSTYRVFLQKCILLLNCYVSYLDNIKVFGSFLINTLWDDYKKILKTKMFNARDRMDEKNFWKYVKHMMWYNRPGPAIRYAFLSKITVAYAVMIFTLIYFFFWNDLTCSYIVSATLHMEIVLVTIKENLILELLIVEQFCKEIRVHYIHNKSVNTKH